MDRILATILALGSIGVFVWLAWPSSSVQGTEGTPGDTDSGPLDFNNSTHLGFLIGLSGGSIPDAVVARYALSRYEEIHGRKATAREIGFLIGLAGSYHSNS